MEQDLKILKDFERDSEWFYEHTDKLRKEGFTGKFVAVKNSQPIVSDERIDIVIEKLEEKGENPSYIFIEFVHPEGFTLVL